MTPQPPASMYLATAERDRSAVTVRVHAIDGESAQVVNIAHKEIKVSARPERVSGPQVQPPTRRVPVASAISRDRPKAISQARRAISGDFRR